eukprot:scaffold8357_cov114-Isochrysis_galbana.AAC.5
MVPGGPRAALALAPCACAAPSRRPAPVRSRGSGSWSGWTVESSSAASGQCSVVSLTGGRRSRSGMYLTCCAFASGNTVGDGDTAAVSI